MTDRDAQALLDELGRLPAEERAARLGQGLDAARLLLALIDAAAGLTTADGRRGLEATELLVTLADQVGGSVARARARRARARALSYAGRLDEAIAVTEESIRIAEAAGEAVEVGRARLASMHALGESGRLEQALEAGHAARRIFEVVGEPGLVARAEINLGVTHQRRDEPDLALLSFDRARQGVEPQLAGHLENNRGEALVALNDFEEAERAFGSALRSFESGGALLNAAIAEGNLADLAAREGSLERALRHFERARRRLEAAQSPAHLARLLAEQADAKAVLGLPDEALAEYRTALAELDRCGLALEAARTRHGMGLVSLRLGRQADAQTLLAAAAVAFEELGHATARARVDLVRAELAAAGDRTDEARRLVMNALAALHERPADAAAGRYLLGRLALQTGDLALAEVELAAALAIAAPLDLPPLVADVRHAEGLLRRQQGQLDRSVTALRAAVEQVERVRGTLQADRLRAAFLGDRAAIYEDLVRSLLDRADRNAVGDAFLVAEQAKSRSLLDRIRMAPVDEGAERQAGADEAESRLRDELRRARSALNALYSRLADDTVPDRGPERERWQDSVHRLESDIDRLEGRLAATGHAGDLYARPLDLESVQRDLPDGTTLLEYFLAGDELVAFVITGDGAIVVRRVGPAKRLQGLVRDLRFQITRSLRPGACEGPQAARRVDDARDVLQRLHELLIVPLGRALDGTDRLAIVPHGLLHLVPFHALWDGTGHLVERHEIVLAPSAGVLAHVCAAHPGGRTGALVVGVADEVSPRIDDEARLVAGMLARPTLLVGQEATARRIRRLAPHASTIHLACHGRFSSDSPSASGIQVADRWLTVRDICDLPLAADLVTLSGCETGLNVVGAGDELMGLTRAVLAAGAASVLVSLWRVDDESTRRLMTGFYDRWGAGRNDAPTKAAALRAAQLEMMQHRPHPALWAPFTLVGRP